MSRLHRQLKNKKEDLNPKMSKKKDKSIVPQSGWYSMVNWFVLLVTILPLLISKITIDPTITVRYLLLSIFMFLFGLNFFLKKTYLSISLTPLIKSVFYFGIGFAIWSFFSLFNSINPGAGYYETARNFLNIILLFVVMVITTNEEFKIIKIFKALLIVSLVNSFIGILQNYNIAFAQLPGNFKPYGLMANRNLFGSAQAFLLPFALYVLYKSSILWKYISIAAIIGIIVSLIISQTRSAWLAATSMLIVTFILIILLSKTNRKKWAIGYAVGLTSVVGLVFIILKTDTEESLSLSLKERAASIMQPNLISTGQSAENIRDRLKIWDKTYKLIKDNPIIGVGPSNWKLTVLKYGSKGMAWEGGIYVPDRPHNIYLQVISETGIPGAIFYFGMWILIAIIAVKVILNPQTEDKRILMILMISGLAAFASDNMFSFPNERIEHTLYITLMAGVILGSYINCFEKGKDKKQLPKRELLIIPFLIIVFNVFIGFKKYDFEKHMNLAKAYLDEGNSINVITETEAGKNTWVTVDPEGIPIEVYSSVAYKNMRNFNKALEEANLAKKYNPNSMMVLNNMGTIYTELGQYDKAIESYLQAQQLTPGSEAVLKNLAYNYYQVGNYINCIKTLEKVNIKNDKFLLNLLNEAQKKVTLK